MKIEQILTEANRHSDRAFKAVLGSGMESAEALTLWAYLASKLLVLILMLYGKERSEARFMIDELHGVVEQQFKEYDEFNNNSK